MKRALLSIGILLFLTSCAEVQHVEDCLNGYKYGFFNGWWHGLTTPFAFILSLFNDNIAIYATNNNGGWYNFGYVLGIGGCGSILKIKISQ